MNLVPTRFLHVAYVVRKTVRHFLAAENQQHGDQLIETDQQEAKRTGGGVSVIVTLMERMKEAQQLTGRVGIRSNKHQNYFKIFKEIVAAGGDTVILMKDNRKCPTPKSNQWE